VEETIGRVPGVKRERQRLGGQKKAGLSWCGSIGSPIGEDTIHWLQQEKKNWIDCKRKTAYKDGFNLHKSLVRGQELTSKNGGAKLKFDRSA